MIRMEKDWFKFSGDDCVPHWEFQVFPWSKKGQTCKNSKNSICLALQKMPAYLLSKHLAVSCHEFWQWQGLQALFTAYPSQMTTQSRGGLHANDQNRSERNGCWVPRLFLTQSKGKWSSSSDARSTGLHSPRNLEMFTKRGKLWFWGLEALTRILDPCVIKGWDWEMFSQQNHGTFGSYRTNVVCQLLCLLLVRVTAAK